MINSSYTKLNNIEDANNFGMQLSMNLDKGIVILRGELGAGKTTLCRSIIQYHCGKNTVVNSPTFNILQLYHSKDLIIYHYDLYRINNVEEIKELGLEQAWKDKSICLIEWPEIVIPYLPKPYWDIQLKYINLNEREIQCNLITS